MAQSHPSRDPGNQVVKPATRPGSGPPLAAATKLPPKPEADKGEPTASSMVPPGDTTWEKYAPNGEPIISGISSLLLHVVFLLVVVTGLLSLFSSSPPPVEELEPVEIGNGEEGGGGGHKEGVEIGAPGNLTRAQDDQASLDQNKTPPAKELPEDDPTVKAKTGPTIQDDPLADTLAEKIKSKPNAANLGPVLKDALEGLAGKGLGGSGRGGGEGTGVGRGRGSGTGDGTGRTNRRGRRVLRWEMVFNTGDAANYLQQLDALGAIIAVPDKAGKLMTIRNIKERPAKPQYEDVKALNRIYWVDDRRDSADSIAAVLGLDIVPAAIVAFFPQTLEQELLKKELEFRKRREEDIEYTRFSIAFSGGKPVIRVTEQRAFGGK